MSRPTTVSVGPRHPHALVSKALNCLVAAGGNDSYILAGSIAEDKAPALPVLPKIFAHLHQRAAVGAQALGTSDPFNWSREVFDSLVVDELRALIARFTRVPPRIKVPTENSAGGSATFVGQGLPSALAKSVTGQQSLDAFQLVTAPIVLTKELFRFGVNTETTFMRILRDQVSRGLAKALFDPAQGATSAQPASLTNGSHAVTSTGTTAAQMTADFNNMEANFFTAMVDPVVIMRPKTWFRIATTLGGAGLNVSKDNLFGMPVFTLSGMPQEIVIVDCASVLYCGDDQAEINVSTDATVEMSDAPSQSGISGTGAQQVSLWQSNLVGIYVTLIANWANVFTINASPNTPSGIVYMSVAY